jgi:hypothetical protein
MQPQNQNPLPPSAPLPQQQYPPQMPGTPAPSQPSYDFILNPAPPPKRLPLKNLGRGSSLPRRLLLAVAVFFVLVLLAVVLKSLLSGSSSNSLVLTAAVQQQQELIHIVSNANNISQQQSSLSTTDQNFSTTAQLAVSSQQQQLLAYLKANGHSLSAQQVALKVSTAVDNQLNAALTASTFDQSFREVMQQQLTNYERALSQAYKVTTGAKGRQLLKTDYTGAQLLLQQLSSPAS